MTHNIYKGNLAELININYSNGNTKKAKEIYYIQKALK